MVKKYVLYSYRLTRIDNFPYKFCLTKNHILFKFRTFDLEYKGSTGPSLVLKFIIRKLLFMFDSILFKCVWAHVPQARIP